jgi:hypothetical protein
MTCPKQSESGLMALSVILTSTLILFLIFTTFTYKAFAIKNRSRHSCHTEALSAQRDQALTLRQLLALNPPAKALRTQRKVATRIRNASRGNPAAFAAAQLALEAIKANQRALRARQAQLILQSKLQWQKAEALSRLGPHRTSLSYQRPQTLPVVKVADKWGSPTYKPAPRLTQLQQSQIRWVVSIGLKIPILVEALKTRKIKILVSCSSTLKKRGRKWVPVLKKVNPLLKSA